MAGRDQALFADALLAFRRSMKRRAYDSDSDSSIDEPTNRGNKLKKRARFVRRGQLVPSSGASTYKEVVEHAGFQREILFRNPPLVDEEGYEIESGDDAEHIRDAVAAAAEVNPYAAVHLETILAPLTSITDLPNHPTLSRPLTSKALTELAEQGSGWMQKEASALWKVKPLLTRLCGDQTWAPCDMMVADNDADLFEDDFVGRLLGRGTNGSAAADAERKTTPVVNGDRTSEHKHGGVNGDSAERTVPVGEATDGPPTRRPEDDIAMADAGANEKTEGAQETPPKGHRGVNGDRPPSESDPKGRKKVASEDPPPRAKKDPADRPAVEHDGSNGVNKSRKEKAPSEEALKMENGVGDDTEITIDAPADEEAQEAAGAGPPHTAAPNTNGGARAMSATPDIFDEPPIHPLFLAPRSAHLERDLGLPEPEAEDVRRLLQLWVQKQEEVARGTQRLYDGLLKADRMRSTVYKWAKAEAHSGPNRDMSDGEDWYDKEEWGLAEDLKKGHDEEEEDTQQTQKKTRTRR